MRNRLPFLLAVMLILVTSCKTKSGIGLEANTGFTELPFPNNSYKPGQIVEIYSSPRKIEITHQPDINWDLMTTSSGWNISSNDTRKVTKSISAELVEILKGSYASATEQNVTVEFTDTKTYTIQKSTIYSAIKKALNDEADLHEMISNFMKDGRQYSVITTALSANIGFTLTSAENDTIDIDTEVIDKINSRFNVDYKKQATGNLIKSGKNLVIGIHTDPKMMRIIMEDIQKSNRSK